MRAYEVAHLLTDCANRHDRALRCASKVMDGEVPVKDLHAELLAAAQSYVDAACRVEGLMLAGSVVPIERGRAA